MDRLRRRLVDPATAAARRRSAGGMVAFGALFLLLAGLSARATYRDKLDVYEAQGTVTKVLTSPCRARTEICHRIWYWYVDRDGVRHQVSRRAYRTYVTGETFVVRVSPASGHAWLPEDSPGDFGGATIVTVFGAVMIAVGLWYRVLYSASDGPDRSG